MGISHLISHNIDTGRVRGGGDKIDLAFTEYSLSFKLKRTNPRTKFVTIESIKTVKVKLWGRVSIYTFFIQPHHSQSFKLSIFCLSFLH